MFNHFTRHKHLLLPSHMISASTINQPFGSTRGVCIQNKLGLVFRYPIRVGSFHVSHMTLGTHTFLLIIEPCVRHYVKTSNRSHNICNRPLTPITWTPSVTVVVWCPLRISVAGSTPRGQHSARYQ
jgi:hypothetical protein